MTGPMSSAVHAEHTGARPGRYGTELECEIEIEDLDHEGRGVGRVDSKVVFVDGALPGERVRATVRRRRKKFNEGTVIEVLRASPDRVEPRCPHFGICGGCSLQHLSPDAQVQIKAHRLLEDLSRIGGVAPREVLEPIQAEPWSYRRKARLAVRYVAGKGGALVGFRERKTTYIADIHGCPVLRDPAGHRIDALRDLISGMDANARIPQVEVAVAGERLSMVVRHLDPLTSADRDRLKSFARREHVSVWLQPGGPETVAALYPELPPPLSYRIPEFDVEVQFEPTDFAQVNAAVNELLVSRAVGLLEIEPGHRVLDLFCGVGNFTLPLARRARSVLGVEGSAGLIGRARANAHRNRIGNVEFLVADLHLAEPLAAAAVAAGRPGFDAMLLDPPRSGAQALVESLGEPRPRRIVYVSCHSATLARDAAILVQQHGYRLELAGVADMFPHTGHAEAVALFVQH